jgi:peptide/nickel transport system permease protein
LLVYIAKRVLQAVGALFVLSVIIFLLAHLTGDPLHMMLPPYATPEDYERVRTALGLDKPLYIQYAYFMQNAIQGDFGLSFRTREPILGLMMDRLPNSLSLAGAAMLVVFIFAMPLGVLAAVKRGTLIDATAKVVALLGQSLPPFWIAIVFVEIFAVRLNLLPTSGMAGPSTYILPAVTLGMWTMAGVMRLLRSSMLEVLDSDFVRLAYSKGASPTIVIWKHTLRNALIPVVTFSGLYFAVLVTMSIVVEVVFSWPGIGRLVYEAILFRDYPLIQSVVLLIAVIVMVINLGVDVLYSVIDPRIRVK